MFVGGTWRQLCLHANVKRKSKRGDRASVKNEKSGVRVSVKKSTRSAGERGQNQSGQNTSDLGVSLNVTVKLDQKTSGDQEKGGEGVRRLHDRDQSGQNTSGQSCVVIGQRLLRLLPMYRRLQRWMATWTGCSNTSLRRAWHCT